MSDATQNTEAPKMAAVAFPGIDNVELRLPEGAQVADVITAATRILQHMAMAGWEHYTDLLVKVSPVSVETQAPARQEASGVE